MAGCDTFSWAASSVSLHGPSRDNRARVKAAVELSSPGHRQPPPHRDQPFQRRRQFLPLGPGSGSGAGAGACAGDRGDDNPKKLYMHLYILPILLMLIQVTASV